MTIARRIINIATMAWVILAIAVTGAVVAPLMVSLARQVLP